MNAFKPPKMPKFSSKLPSQLKPPRLPAEEGVSKSKHLGTVPEFHYKVPDMVPNIDPAKQTITALHEETLKRRVAPYSNPSEKIESPKPISADGQPFTKLRNVLRTRYGGSGKY